MKNHDTTAPAPETGRLLAARDWARLPVDTGLALAAGDVLATGSHWREGEELPYRFRLLAYGPGSLTVSGERIPYHFRPEHARQIVAHAEAKGDPIPIDCEHAAFHLAQQLGKEEGDAVKDAIPGERPACGFVRLRLEKDGLWAEVERWIPRAAFLLREKMYRYFSPVIRGLRHGNLRLTSLALTNRPALDGLEPLVATTDAGGERSATESGLAPKHKEKGKTMNRWLQQLAGLLGMESIVPGQDGDIGPEANDRLQELKAELQTLRQARDGQEKFLGDIAAPLALAADADLAVVEGRVMALAERAQADAAALTSTRAELTQLQRRRSDEEKQRLLDAGLAEGKLTPALVESWANRQDVATLTAFLQHTPTGIFVPTGRVPVEALLPADELAAGARLREVARHCGVNPERVQQFACSA